MQHAATIAALAAHTPMLLEHLEASGLALTTSGIQIQEGRNGWELRAHAYDARTMDEVPVTVDAAGQILTHVA